MNFQTKRNEILSVYISVIQTIKIFKHEHSKRLFQQVVPKGRQKPQEYSWVENLQRRVRKMVRSLIHFHFSLPS